MARENLGVAPSGNNDLLRKIDVENSFGAWSAWTPVWTQSATITKTIVLARYFQFGKLVIARAVMTATSGGTAGQVVNVSIPVTAQGSGGTVGNFVIQDASPNTFYAGTVVMATTTTLGFVVDGTAGNLFGATPAITTASGDGLSFTVFYEAA